MKILALGDDQDILALPDVLRETLPEGIWLTRAEGAKGFDLVRVQDPDVILLDLSGSGSEGIEICQKLKADEQGRAIPVVCLIPRSALREHRVRALAAGAEIFVSQPVEALEVTAAIRAMARLKAVNVAERRVAGAAPPLWQTRTGLLDALPAHIALLDQRGVITMVNEAWRRFGAANALLAPEFTRGQNYVEICERARGDRGAEAPAAALGIRRILAGELRDFTMEYPCHSPSEQRWFRMTVTPLSDTGSLGAMVMHTDISERQRTQLALAQSEQKFRQLVQHMQVALVEHGPDTRVLYWNSMATRLLGLTAEQIQGKTALDPAWKFIHEDGRRMAVEDYPVMRALRAADGIVNDLVAGIRRPDREHPIWVQCNAHTNKGPDGQIQAVVVTFADVTERKRAEETSLMLATAVEQAAESIVITDPNGEILYVNPAFENNTGFTRAEALGRNPRILKSGRHDAGFYRELWETLGRGEIWRGHFVNQRKDGTIYEEEATISPVRDASGKTVKYAAMKRDVTREVQLEAQFRQAQKMEAIGQLAGGVAHDFNNILAAMLLQTGLTELVEQLPAEARNGLREIRAYTERAANLTRQLLLFSRREVMQPRALDLNEVVVNLARMLQRIIGEVVRVQLKLDSRPILVRADEGMLDQVLMNLAVNARDAMPEGGRLLIETTEETLDGESARSYPEALPGSYACLTVRDTGCGIPPEVLPRIFEPFFTTKEPGKGTGLGLATVFGIVKQHQGWLTVASEPGQGATFRIFLPTLAAGAADLPEAGTRPVARRGRETILLVEDEWAVRSLTSVVLSQHGYRVLEAANGVQALAVWREHRIRIANPG